MDFEDAIAAHVRWKTRLRMFTSGAGEKLESAVVSKDNMCDLGKWIYGAGSKYSSLPSYQRLKVEHGNFHKEAASVVRKVEAGDKDGAKAMLEAGAFSSASNKTVTAIMEMKKEAGK